MFKDKADWTGALLIFRDCYDNELMKSSTPGAKISLRPFQLHGPWLWVPWTSIFELGLRVFFLTSCLIQGITALGLVRCWLFYQVSASSVEQPARYQLLLCDGSLMLSYEACPRLSGQSARSDMVRPCLHLDLGAHIREQMHPTTYHHSHTDPWMGWSSEGPSQPWRPLSRQKSLDKDLKITLAGFLYLASPWSLLNEVCMFIQMLCSQGSFGVEGKNPG